MFSRGERVDSPARFSTNFLAVPGAIGRAPDGRILAVSSRARVTDDNRHPAPPEPFTA